MPPDSIGLFLETQSRKGPFGAPYTVQCNVTLSTLHNTSVPIWRFPSITFYAEQNREFFALRRIEAHGGGISPPYCMTRASVTLPRPPRPGKWRIFAIEEHSEKIYGNHLEFHPEKTPIVFVGEQDQSRAGMWTAPLISNSIVVEFSELDENGMQSAESVIQGLIDAEQYYPDFREPRDDPTRRIRRRR